MHQIWMIEPNKRTQAIRNRKTQGVLQKSDRSRPVDFVQKQGLKRKNAFSVYMVPTGHPELSMSVCKLKNHQTLNDSDPQEVELRVIGVKK